MTTPIAAAALDGGDPRLSTAGQGITDYSRSALRSLHDPSVSLEEYLHYARLTRAEEKALPDVKSPLGQVLGFKKNHGSEKGTITTPGQSVDAPSTVSGSGEKQAITDSSAPDVSVVTADEWTQAARAMRTASWGAVFYLITTDVLGPYSVPWAFSQMGYGPGVTLYTIFGVLAGLTGYYMWCSYLL